jgi:hypothetical protein
LLWQLKLTAAAQEVIRSNEGELTDCISGNELSFNDAVSKLPMSEIM